MLEDETFGGDGLRRFIRDHEDHLGEVEDNLQNLITMTDRLAQDLQITKRPFQMCCGGGIRGRMRFLDT